jgi:hypothetical protein
VRRCCNLRHQIHIDLLGHDGYEASSPLDRFRVVAEFEARVAIGANVESILDVAGVAMHTQRRGALLHNRVHLLPGQILAQHFEIG